MEQRLRSRAFTPHSSARSRKRRRRASAPNGAKTPEQSLYSAFFREIKEKETPRVRKSAARRGAFEFNA